MPHPCLSLPCQVSTVCRIACTASRVTDPTAASSVLQAGQPISITAQDSTDPDLDYLFYRWDWGDGTTLGAYDDNVIITSHTYAAAGTYTIRLTLTDNFGATARK